MQIIAVHNPNRIVDPDTVTVIGIPPGTPDAEVAAFAGWDPEGRYYGYSVTRHGTTATVRLSKD